MNHKTPLENRRNVVPLFRSVAAFLVGGMVGYGYVNHRCSHTLRRQFLPPEQEVPQTAPQPGDILLFHNARGANNLIDWLTGSPFYHVGLYAGDGQVVEARTRGVVHDSLRDRLHNFVVVPAPEGAGTAALNWAESRVGAPYDKLDAAVIFLEHIFTHLHLNYTPGDRFTCGEFVATAFAQAGVPLFPDRDLADVVPADFMRFLPREAIPRH